jgi:hypothetical protein
MPTALPKLADLLPPLDGRPLSRHEWNEIRAVRLALVMVTAVLHQGNFLDPYRPIKGGYDADLAFLFQHLEPLDRVSPTVRKIRSLFDRLRYSREFSNTTKARRNLKTLAKDAVVLAGVIDDTVTPPLPRGRRR